MLSVNRKTSLHYLINKTVQNVICIFDCFSWKHLECHKALAKKRQLDSQLSENKAVKEELDLLKPNNEVFKLIGPVLVKQDQDEAKQNVEKRMEYISSEL